MKYASLLFILGGLQFAAGLGRGGAFYLLAYSGFSFVAAGLGYAFIGPAVFGKRPDGRLDPLRVFLTGPFLILTWLTWHVQTGV